MLLRSVSEVRTKRDFLHLVRAFEQELDAMALANLRGALRDGGSSVPLIPLAPVRRGAPELADEVDRRGSDLGPREPFAPRIARLRAELEDYWERSASSPSRLPFPESLTDELEGLRSGAQAALDQADESVDRAEDRLFLLAVVLPPSMLLLLLVLALRLSGRVLKPARVLQQAMEELRSGGWPSDLQDRGLPELGDVTRTFNALAHEKRELEEELREAQLELESRVERRTLQLEGANRALAEEVEERRGTELRLRSSEERFRRMFAVGPMGIAIFSVEGEFLEVNERLRELLGPGTDFVGRRMDEFFDAPRAAELREEFRAAVRAGEPSLASEVEITRTDGETRLVSFVASVVRSQSGEVDYGLLMVRDISESRRAEELLLETERFAAMGRMAARIAHEINNPLAGIKNAFRLIRPAVAADHPFAHYVPRIDHEIDRLAKIVREMYELYRPASETQEEFWVDEAVSDVVALLRVASADSNIQLDVNRARVRARLGSGLLRQVLYNLIQNALEHSPLGSPVRVRAGVELDELQLSVTDHGEGIRLEDRLRIFDSFFSTKEGRSNAGLGLGLAIAHSAVEAMGGRMELESEVGVGSCFTVHLPLSSPQTSARSGSSALVALPS